MSEKQTELQSKQKSPQAAAAQQNDSDQGPQTFYQWTQDFKDSAWTFPFRMLPEALMGGVKLVIHAVERQKAKKFEFQSMVLTPELANPPKEIGPENKTAVTAAQKSKINEAALKLLASQRLIRQLTETVEAISRQEDSALSAEKKLAVKKLSTALKMRPGDQKSQALKDALKDQHIQDDLNTAFKNPVYQPFVAPDKQNATEAEVALAASSFRTDVLPHLPAMILQQQKINALSKKLTDSPKTTNPKNVENLLEATNEQLAQLKNYSSLVQGLKIDASKPNDSPLLKIAAEDQHMAQRFPNLVDSAQLERTLVLKAAYEKQQKEQEEGLAQTQFANGIFVRDSFFDSNNERMRAGFFAVDKKLPHAESEYIMMGGKIEKQEEYSKLTKKMEQAQTQQLYDETAMQRNALIKYERPSGIFKRFNHAKTDAQALAGADAMLGRFITSGAMRMDKNGKLLVDINCHHSEKDGTTNEDKSGNTPRVSQVLESKFSSPMQKREMRSSLLASIRQARLLVEYAKENGLEIEIKSNIFNVDKNGQLDFSPLGEKDSKAYMLANQLNKALDQQEARDKLNPGHKWKGDLILSMSEDKPQESPAEGIELSSRSDAASQASSESLPAYSPPYSIRNVLLKHQENLAQNYDRVTQSLKDTQEERHPESPRNDTKQTPTDVPSPMPSNSN